MCSCFSKSEDEYFLAMKLAAKETFENKLSNYKTIRAYFNHLLHAVSARNALFVE